MPTVREVLQLLHNSSSICQSAVLLETNRSAHNLQQKKIIRSSKKISVFRVTRPYLNLLRKPRAFYRFYGKIYNCMH